MADVIQDVDRTADSAASEHAEADFVLEVAVEIDYGRQFA